MTAGSAEPPRWLWRGAWVILAGVLALATGGAMLLGAGLAEPPRAGPLRWESTQGEQWALEISQDKARKIDCCRLRPPFTVELTARMSASSSKHDYWAVKFHNYSLGLSDATSLIIIFYSDGLFYIESGRADDMIEFPHLLPQGQFNHVAITVNADQTAILRINDEIAWRGTYLIAHEVDGGLEISALASGSTGATVTWQKIAVYAP